MSIFHRRRTGKNGKSQPDAAWTVEFADHDGIVRRVSAFTDKSASLELERQLKKLVSLRMAGATPDVELSRFLESCPDRILGKLGEWNIITGERAAAGKTLVAHIEDWRLALEAKGNSVRHVRNFLANLNHLAVDCGWKHVTDIAAADLVQWIAARKVAGRSAATINHHIRASKGFCGWLAKGKRITENPLAHVPLLNEKADRRIERHPYSIEELGLLLAATENGETRYGLTGHERSLVYRLAVDTGLRWTELRSLTRASFDFTAEPATVTIAAKSAKNRKEDTLPLRPALSADLKQHMAFFLPKAKAFAKMGTDCGAEMIRADLETAGIVTRNADGEQIVTDSDGAVYDFHSLRHTFATLLNKARVPLATAQRLMRHSDPKLTAGIYTHVLVADKADELAKLPEIAAATTGKEAAAKTGTTDVIDEEAVNLPFFRDRIMDSFSPNADGRIRTCADDETTGNKGAEKGAETKNPPVRQGENDWWGEMDSNHRRAEPDRFTVCSLWPLGHGNIECTVLYRYRTAFHNRFAAKS